MLGAFAHVPPVLKDVVHAVDHVYRLQTQRIGRSHDGRQIANIIKALGGEGVGEGDE